MKAKHAQTNVLCVTILTSFTNFRNLNLKNNAVADPTWAESTIATSNECADICAVDSMISMGYSQ